MTHSNISIINNDILIGALWAGYVDCINNVFWYGRILGSPTMYDIPTDMWTHSYEDIEKLALEYIDEHYDEILKLAEKFKIMNV